MTPLRTFLLVGWLVVSAGAARATFSIVAVDPETGEVGSAGASCVTSAIQISDVHPGVGAIHTQADNLWANYVNARNLMDQGWSPQEIIDWMIVHDAEGTPLRRQYLAVDLVAGGRRAAYTGVDCDEWKGHRLGPTFAIAGNTLLGPTVIAAMETAFVNTDRSLAHRLMAALQAANVTGADWRCASDGKPALSAFLIVARPGDADDDYYLQLNVPDTGPGQNPIDLLQEQFDLWAATDTTSVELPPAIRVLNRPNPFNPQTEVRYWLERDERVDLRVFDVMGREVRVLVAGGKLAGWHVVIWDGRDDAGRDLPAGEYIARLVTSAGRANCRMMMVR